MRPAWRMALVLMLMAMSCGTGRAQTFSQFRCGDGTELPAVFYDDTHSVSLQLDGKSIHLPRRVSLSGVRYAKDGVTLRISKQVVTLKRKGLPETVCRPG